MTRTSPAQAWWLPPSLVIVFKGSRNLTVSVLFPRVAVTNYHQLGGLKQQKWILSKFWKPEVRIKWAGCASPKGLREGSFLPPPASGLQWTLSSSAFSPVCVWVQISLCL